MSNVTDIVKLTQSAFMSMQIKKLKGKAERRNIEEVIVHNTI